MFPPVILHRNPGLASNGLGVVELIYPVLEVLPGVGPSALLSGLGTLDKLLGVDHAVLQLQSLHEITIKSRQLITDHHCSVYQLPVPDHSSVR